MVRPFGVNLRVSVYVGGETNVKTEDDAGGIRREDTSIEFRWRESLCLMVLRLLSVKLQH